MHTDRCEQQFAWRYYHLPNIFDNISYPVVTTIVSTRNSDKVFRNVSIESVLQENSNASHVLQKAPCTIYELRLNAAGGFCPHHAFVMMRC